MNTSDNKETTRTEIHTIGEFGLIDKVIKPFSIVNKSTLKGIGDDAAVIDNEGFKTVISTDMLIEGIHFDLMYHPLKHLGYKAVVVNLSDIYAMNAIPKQIFVSIGISNRFSVEAVEELYWGIKKACERYGVDLAGGDTTSSPRGLVLSITAVGQGVQEKLVYRNGAKVGDLICVSGDLGAAYLGLQLLEREKRLFLDNPEIQPDFGENNYLIGRQLKPEARVDIIDLFDKNNIVPTSMMDISDGLASEVFHLCKQSNVGAFIEEEGVPLLIDTEMQAIQFGLDPITCALSGGEDYELLFTVKPGDIDKIKFLTDIYIIGEIVPAEDGVTLHTKGGNRHAITAQGWTHFSS
jgi:thiamine-monophosphate kinase